ncbi:MAG: S41 family peptidase [Ornithinibacter sp.]
METTDTPPDARAVAGRCADLVAERFVLSEVGARAATRLHERAASGAYDALDPATLAATLSADLHAVAHDLHLRVIHHPDGVPPTEDPSAYEEYWCEMARTTAGGMRRVERLAGNVAHLSIGPVLAAAGPSWDAVTAAMALVADADALVLDVRECRGGDPDTVQLLMSHLVGDEPVRLVDVESRVEGLRQRWTHPVAVRRFGPDRPLVVLTSATTFSGGEEVAFDVQLLGRGTVVGERTRGGANPREGVAVHPELELAVPVARAISPHDGSSWEGAGVQPDVECPAAEALDRALALLRGA